MELGAFEGGSRNYDTDYDLRKATWADARERERLRFPFLRHCERR